MSTIKYPHVASHGRPAKVADLHTLNSMSDRVHIKRKRHGTGVRQGGRPYTPEYAPRRRRQAYFPQIGAKRSLNAITCESGANQVQ